eukprot:26143-Pelagomonas_calceolata.AAC.10
MPVTKLVQKDGWGNVNAMQGDQDDGILLQGEAVWLVGAMMPHKSVQDLVAGSHDFMAAYHSRSEYFLGAIVTTRTGNGNAPLQPQAATHAAPPSLLKHPTSKGQMLLLVVAASSA